MSPPSAQASVAPVERGLSPHQMRGGSGLKRGWKRGSPRPPAGLRCAGRAIPRGSASCRDGPSCGSRACTGCAAAAAARTDATPGPEPARHCAAGPGRPRSRPQSADRPGAIHRGSRRRLAARSAGPNPRHRRCRDCARTGRPAAPAASCGLGATPGSAPAARAIPAPRPRAGSVRRRIRRTHVGHARPTPELRNSTRGRCAGSGVDVPTRADRQARSAACPLQSTRPGPREPPGRASKHGCCGPCPVPARCPSSALCPRFLAFRPHPAFKR